MNGDLTRDTFDPRDGFTAVRAQQGRVMLDADYNEQLDIQLDDVRQGRRDLVGPSGAPADDPGFGISLSGGQPAVGAGRFIVDGLRVRNDAQRLLASGQPFLAGDTLPASEGAWLAYLDVWERPLTAVEEPSIREVALGGPDTTLRDQLVWQVRWLRLGPAGAATTCAAAAAALQDLAQRFDGTLEPGLETSTESGPCIVSEAAQFRGLENQLYRVEIHAGNLDADGQALSQAPTYKWSRDNGAVVAGVVGLPSTSPIRLQVERLGPGGAAGFDRGVTVEIRNEASVLAGTPGILARVDDVEGDVLIVALLDGASVAALQVMLGGARVIVRRWDSAGARAVHTEWAPLEQGIRLRFGAGGRYRTGDFWLIPARTAALPGTSSPLDWPLVPATTGYEALRTRGPAHRRAALAILDRDAGGAWSLRTDCRQIFPPLTSVVGLTPAGGDGQHAPAGEWLPAPIAVVVARGRIPVADAAVRFRVTSGGGTLAATDPSSAPAGSSELTVRTATDGRAAAFWRLGAAPAVRPAGSVWEPATAQQVEVTRIGADGQPDGPALTFVAQAMSHLNLHIAGGNGQQGRPGETLEVALRVRIDDGQRVVENALVEFSVLNRVFNGSPLDQLTGGSVHASARFESGDTWPGGTRHHTVRTRTDAEGVAQVQWTLGTHTELTTQRVEARLLHPAEANRTPQAALFVAQLALAGEVAWLPQVPWLAAVLGAANRRVQAAIDAIATRLDQVANSTTAFNPFLGLQWRATDNQLHPLDGTQGVPLARFAAVVFRNDLVPEGRNPNATALHSGVRVYAELPAAGGGISQVVHLTGSFRRTAGRWEWALSSEARGVLNQHVTGTRPVPVRVTVVPRWLPGGQPTDASVSYELLFLLVASTSPYGLRLAVGGRQL